MQYGEVITRALSITWRHKYLWLLALFAGESTTSISLSAFSRPSTGTNSTSTPTMTPVQVWNTVTSWIATHAFLLVIAGILLLAVTIAFVLLSAVVNGALVKASAEYDAEQPFSLGQAWSAGLVTFWPVLKVKLFTVAVAITAIVVIGGLIALTALLATQGAVVAAVVFGIPAGLLALAAIPASIVFAVVVLFAVRSVVLEGTSASAAFGSGFRIIRQHLGGVALLWLIIAGLGLAAGIASGVVAVLVLLFFAGLVAAAYLVGGIMAAVAAGALLGLLWLGLLLILSGAVSAFTSTYWTLGYTRLEIEPQPTRQGQLPPLRAA